MVLVYYPLSIGNYEMAYFLKPLEKTTTTYGCYFQEAVIKTYKDPAHRARGAYYYKAFSSCHRPSLCK